MGPRLVGLALLVAGCGPPPATPPKAKPALRVEEAPPEAKPLRELARLGDRRFHSESPITSALFSADGKELVVATDAGLERWSLEGERLARTDWQALDARRLLATPDAGEVLLAGSSGVAVWSLAGPQRLRRLDAAIDERVDARGRFFAHVELQTQRVRVIELSEGREVFAVTPAGTPSTVAVAPDGSHVAVTFFVDGCFEVWRTADGASVLKEPRVLGDHCEALAFAADGRRIAVASDSIRVWDVTTGGRVDGGDGDGQFGASLAFHDRHVWQAVDVLGERWIRRFDPTRDKDRHAELRGAAVALSPDGHRLVAVTTHGLASCDAETLACSEPVRHAEAITHLAALGGTLVSSAADGSVLAWQLGDELEAAAILHKDAHLVTLPVCASSFGFALAGAFAPGDSRWSRLDVKMTGRDPLQAPRWTTEAGFRRLRGLGVDGERAIVRALLEDGNVVELDLRDGRQRRILPLDDNDWDARERFGLLSPRGDAVIFRAHPHAELLLLPEGTRLDHALKFPCAFDAAGDAVVCASEELGRLAIAEVRGDAPLQLVSARSETSPQALALSTDPSRIAAYFRPYSDAGEIVIFDDQGSELARAGWTGAEITAMTFFVDGQRLATGHADGAVRIWAVP